MYIVVAEDERGALVSEHALYEGELHIGRTPDNDVVLGSGTVSRRHARVYIDENAAWIVDQGSSNGVMVDERLIKGATQVDESSQIRIGEFRIFLERATGKLQAPQNGISTAIVHPEQAHAKLVVISGPQAGREYLLYEPVVSIGRTDENDITLAHASVSRHHARLKLQDDGSYALNDLNSSNGTLLNNRRTQASRAWHGDRVQFGNVECLLVDAKGRKGRRHGVRPKVWMWYAAAVLGAALIGALVSLLGT